MRAIKKNHQRNLPTQPHSSLQRRSHKVAQLLHKQYCSPRHGNKRDPLDELVFIILSLMTTHQSFNRVYERLRNQVGRWDRLLKVNVRRLKLIIKDAGLSNQKAPRIIEILLRLKNDFGVVSLAPLRKMKDSDVEAYLTSLPGVGPKTAKCVMMYSLNRKVLPVDTHVWRLAKRLGLVSSNVSYSNVHPALEGVVLPDDRYRFHVNAISHGRAICRPVEPRCDECCIRRLCPYPKPLV